MTVKATYELHFGDAAATVAFVLTTDREWVAQVEIGSFSTLIRQSCAGHFHPCDSHAERLYFVALDRVNSGRAA